MTSHTQNGPRRGIPGRLIGWAIPVVLLSIPLIAGFPWTPLDYVFAAVLFGLVGLCLELGVRSSDSTAYRIAVGLAVLASFLLVWLNAAVGIIGDEEPANLLFLGVIAIAFAGSAIGRFRAPGMVAELAVPFVAYAFALAPLELLLRREVPVLTVFFTLLWLVSAWLFRRAARGHN